MTCIFESTLHTCETFSSPLLPLSISQRNYRTFLLFVFTSTVLCLYVIGCGLAQLFVRHNELVNQGDTSPWGPTLVDCAPALALTGYCFLFMWFVGGLSGFHCYLVATNQTTYENFRWETGGSWEEGEGRGSG